MKKQVEALEVLLGGNHSQAAKLFAAIEAKDPLVLW